VPVEHSMDELLERSSLGTPAARQVRAHTPRRVTERIIEQTSGDPRGSIKPLHMSPASDTTPLPTQEKSSMSKSRRTSASAAKAASKVLRDGRTSKTSKTAAGSALSQRAPKKSR
jgi:hypothetical protein